ncbi:MAG: ABC transporter ATP-binding protein [Ignavibacteria bacterium]
MEHLRFLFKFGSKNRKKLIIALACLSFVSLSNLIYPWLFKLMIDYLVNGNKTGAAFNIPLVTAIFAGVIILSTVLGYYTSVLMQELGFELRNDVRSGYFRSLLNKPYPFFKNEAVGSLTSRATEDIGKLQSVYTGLLVPFYQNVLFITGCLILMLMLNPAATGIVFAIILSGIPVMHFFSKRIKKLSGEAQREHASANAVMDESLTGIREVKAFLLEKLRLRKYSDRSKAALEMEMKSSSYQAKSTQSVFVIVSLLLLLIFYMGVSGGSSWSPGSAVAFYFYAYSLTMAFLSLGRVYTHYNQITGSTARIVEIIGDGKSIQAVTDLENNNPANKEKLKGAIEFKNVTFGYSEDKTVLNNVSFSANKGDWLLITGPSGSGKSTITNLLMGFYKAKQGEILFDGKNIDETDINTIRGNIGYVGQEAVLFEGTIRENIMVSGGEDNEKTFSEILRVSMADKFIDGLPKGADTNIAERGVTLSAGQRSRIAIARALAADPAILLLDEANSMLEESLEEELWKNLYELRKNKTTIIFSHHTEAIPKVYKQFAL